MATSAALKPTEALQDELFASVTKVSKLQGADQLQLEIPMKRGGDFSLLERALAQEDTARFVTEITDADERSLLHVAAAANNAKAVELLLAKGVNSFTTDESGWTPLQSAASLGAVEIAEMLLKSVKDAGEKQRFIEAINESGSRAIHYAASKGYLPVVELLLREGADVNAKGFGNHTALSRAVAAGKEEVVQYLLSVPGVDLRIKETKTGDNLLHIAVNSEKATIYWDVAARAPELEDEPNAEGKPPIACASRDFMKKLEYVFKQSKAADEAGEP